MRCREALQRLNQHSLSTKVTDKDLVEHLRACQSCAQHARASQLLAQDIQLTNEEASTNITPLTFLKSRIENAADMQKQKESNFMTKIIKNMPAKSRWGVSLTAVAVILLALSLIPFSFDKTVGYEVAFAGVNKDLAMDSEKINTFLIKLGIDGAEVKVSDCTETCKLIITELKSPADAQVIKAALLKSNNVEILHDISEMKEAEKNTLFGNVIKEFHTQGNLHEIDNHFISHDDAVQIVIEKLGADFTVDTMVFFDHATGKTAEFYAESIFFDADSNKIKLFVENKNSTYDIKNDTSIFFSDDNLHREHWNVEHNELAPLVEHIKLDLKDGMIEEDIREKIEALGYDLEVTNEGDYKLIRITGNDKNGKFTEEHLLDETDENGNVAKVGDLPLTFQLHQNYPNPFNPTTNINFSIPTAEHVNLTIINVKGQVVKTLLDRSMPSGSHTIEWNATDQSGNKVASGIYLYRLTAGKYNSTKKMSLIK